MSKDKREKNNQDKIEEPKNRFYVNKWQATDREMREMRKFVKSVNADSRKPTSSDAAGKKIASQIKDVLKS